MPSNTYDFGLVAPASPPRLTAGTSFHATSQYSGTRSLILLITSMFCSGSFSHCRAEGEYPAQKAVLIALTSRVHTLSIAYSTPDTTFWLLPSIRQSSWCIIKVRTVRLELIW